MRGWHVRIERTDGTVEKRACGTRSNGEYIGWMECRHNQTVTAVEVVAPDGTRVWRGLSKQTNERSGER